MRSTTRWAARVATLALATMLVPACGSSNNNSNRVPCLQFTAAAGPATGVVAARNNAGSTCDVAVIDFVVTGVNDVLGANIQVTYDAGEVSFSGASSSDTFLDDDGQPVQLVTGGPVGQLTVGLTRLQTATGIDAVGTQQLVRLTFLRISADNDTTDLAVTVGELTRPGTPPTVIPGLTFTGGTFRIDRM